MDITSDMASELMAEIKARKDKELNESFIKFMKLMEEDVPKTEEQIKIEEENKILIQNELRKEIEEEIELLKKINA